MAQTISLVRGSTTVTGNNSSSVTLFTQGASGIAARVITNQLVFSSSTSQNTTNGGNPSGSIFINGSGVGEGCIGGFVYSNATLGTNAVSIIPSPNGSVALAASTSGVFSTSGYPINTGGIFRLPTSANQHFFSYIPQSFWIGPSDSIIARANFYGTSGKSIQALTVTIKYSFTIILES